MIGLWRTHPRTATGSNRVPMERVFPSARQALTAGLRALGLARADRVALPEWSSQCVITAIGLAATPLPIAEALAAGRRIAAVLLYEQWGWPLAGGAVQRARQRFPGARVVLDAVDSATLDQPCHDGELSVHSLFKVLGLPGGGVAGLGDGRFVDFQPVLDDAALAAHLLAHPDRAAAGDLLKSFVRWMPEDIAGAVTGIDLAAAYAAERAARAGNLTVVADSPGATGWGEWMRAGLAGSPGIAPLLRNRSTETMRAAAAVLADRHGIATAVYHFDFAGDPLAPAYEPCLAFPVHGELTPAQVAAALEDIDHA